MRRLLLCAVLTLAACDPIEEIRNEFAPARTPHETYAAALDAAGLTGTALGRQWLLASEQALRTALHVSVPVHESGYFAPDQPAAVAYRMALVRGQRVHVHAGVLPAGATRLFIDIYRVERDSSAARTHVESADSTSSALEFEPRQSGEYIIRIQPELLRGGRYQLLVRAAPTLAFPVHGAGRRNVQSVFGDARDAGARVHHGIDIFAPRGTPVLAVTAARVTRVSETPRGGRVVWLRDTRRGNSLYYAHLDAQLVQSGEVVAPGDTIGTVGNTGNARTTPPHLHFGIYSRGPVDPLPFVHVADTVAEAPAISRPRLGTFLRARTATRLRRAPGTAAGTITAVDAQTPVRAWSGIRSWYRVALPDGRQGFIAAADLEPTDRPLFTRRAPPAAELLATASPHAPAIAAVDSTATLQVLGSWGRFHLVQVDTLLGWVSIQFTDR